MRPVPDVGGTADSVGNGTGHTSESAKRVPVGSLGMAAGQHHAPYQPASGQSLLALPEGQRQSVHATGRGGRMRCVIIPQGHGLFNVSASRRPCRNRSVWSGKTPRRPAVVATAPAIWPIPAVGVRRGLRPPAGTKKRSPGSGASHHTARKREKYQRLALKNASILSKGMMSTRSYRSVCEAPGTISSSLLSPLSFLKASSLK